MNQYPLSNRKKLNGGWRTSFSLRAKSAPVFGAKNIPTSPDDWLISLFRAQFKANFLKNLKFLFPIPFLHFENFPFPSEPVFDRVVSCVDVNLHI
jgi:hypothetical protein